MSEKRYRLSDMILDEISLVPLGDDPSARVVLHKTAPVEFDLSAAKARVAIAKMRKKKSNTEQLDESDGDDVKATDKTPKKARAC